MTQKIYDYLKETFYFDDRNGFIRNTFLNVIDYGVNNFNNSVDQLAWYLADVIDELTFTEIKEVIDNYKESEEEQWKNIF